MGPLARVDRGTSTKAMAEYASNMPMKKRGKKASSSSVKLERTRCVGGCQYARYAGEVRGRMPIRGCFSGHVVKCTGDLGHTWVKCTGGSVHMG